MVLGREAERGSLSRRSVVTIAGIFSLAGCIPPSTSLFRIFATANGSTMASVLTRMPRSAPMASAVRMVSDACCGPIETATTSVALPASLRRRASSTAISSKGFIDIFTLASSTPLPSVLTRILTLKSTTRLRGTRTFILVSPGGGAQAMTRAAGCPPDVRPPLLVDGTARHKEEIGGPVDVFHRRRRDLLAGPVGKLHHQP